MLPRLLHKMGSGKFLLTVIVGIVFFVGSLKGTISQDNMIQVIMIVITAYFMKNTPTGGSPTGEVK